MVGQNNIVDSRVTTVTLANNTTQTTTWYQFRIPITKPEDPANIINDMSGFTAIRFMRMFMTKFKIPVVLRFGELQLVRGDWRRYTNTLDETIQPLRKLARKKTES